MTSPAQPLKGPPRHPRYTPCAPEKKRTCAYGKTIPKEGDHEAERRRGGTPTPWETWGHRRAPRKGLKAHPACCSVPGSPLGRGSGVNSPSRPLSPSLPPRLRGVRRGSQEPVLGRVPRTPAHARTGAGRGRWGRRPSGESPAGVPAAKETPRTRRLPRGWPPPRG